MEFLLTLLSSFWTLITSIPDLLTGALDFLMLIFLRLPVLITNNLFANLPYVFRYGLMGCFGVVILFSLLKMLKLFKA